MWTLKKIPYQRVAHSKAAVVTPKTWLYFPVLRCFTWSQGRGRNPGRGRNSRTVITVTAPLKPREKPRRFLSRFRGAVKRSRGCGRGRSGNQTQRSGYGLTQVSEWSLNFSRKKRMQSKNTDLVKKIHNIKWGQDCQFWKKYSFSGQFLFNLLQKSCLSFS